MFFMTEPVSNEVHTEILQQKENWQFKIYLEFNFDKFDIELHMLLKLSLPFVIWYIMALQLWGSMKKEVTIAVSGQHIEWYCSL